MKFNQEQQLAINALHKNIMVSASAGSGKTTVLIARLMKRIVTDRISLNEICAMTFTEKAASEMKKRLARQLHEEYHAHQDPFIGQQLSLLATAQISTIHSFCRSIITEFGYLIGFKQDRINHLLDPLAQLKIKQVVNENVLNHYHETQKETFIQLSLAYSTRAFEDELLMKDVANLYTLALAQLDPYQWLEEQKDRYRIDAFEQAPSSLQALLVQFVQPELTELIEDYRTIKRGFSDFQIDEDFSKHDLFFENLNTFIQLKAWSEIRTLIETYDSRPITTFTQKNTKDLKNRPDLQEFNEEIKAFNRRFADFDWSYLYTYETAAAYQQNHDFTVLLCEMAMTYGHYYEALKEDTNVLDFNDLEQVAYQILSHPSGLASNALRERYSDILVDEYQDTNYFQDRIIQLIARKDNVFRVGDVKQSIYGFRNAKPELMMERIKNEDDQKETLYLSYNYRSKEAIVDFNNHIFTHLMNLKDLNSQYTKKDAVKIGIQQQTTDNKPVTLLQVEFDSTMTVDEETIYINKNKALLNKIAQNIKERIDQGRKPRDFCVLARSHSVKRELKAAFELFEIPYFFDDQEGFTNSWSVSDVMHGLQAFHNPQEDYAVLAFLLSGFCQLDENDVAALKLHNSRDTLYNNLQAVFPELHQQLDDLFASMKNQPLSFQMILLTQFNGYYYQHLNETERNNINLLIQKANAFTGSSLEFIDYIELYQDTDSSNAAIDDENSNRVKVMTVHAAKGLQFPVTYYITPQRMSTQSIRGFCLMDSDLGVCFNIIDFASHTRVKSSLRRAFELYLQNKEVQESMRLLYVALTRAQDELILVDGYQEPKETDAKQAPLSWRSLMDGLGHAPIIRQILEAHPFKRVSRQIVKIDAVQTQSKSITTTAFAFQLTGFDPQSVTIDEDTAWSLDLSLDLQPGLKASEIGTLLHEVLSELPLRPWQKSDLAPYALSAKQQQQLIDFSHHPFSLDLMNGTVLHEVGFTHLKEDDLLVGTMDLVVEFEHTVVLVDYKTDRVNSSEILVQRYQSQMQRYTDFLKIQFPDKEIQAYIYSLHLNDYLRLL